MTRVDFYFNVEDKLAKSVELCKKVTDKGRQLTIYTQNNAMNDVLGQALWGGSPASFLTNAQSHEQAAEFSSIVLDSTGERLLQDDVLINLQAQNPPFFSRFRHLIELVGMDEDDKRAARIRFKFYKDRGYTIKTVDVLASL